MPVQTQKHIHLSMDIGDAPENAPDITWAITEWSETPNISVALKRGLMGKLQKHVMKTASGVAVFTDFKYLVRVGDYAETTAERKDMLKAMFGQTVYLVDSIHPDDGEDHADYVHRVFLAQLGSFDKFEPSLSRFYVPVELVDDYTVI